MAEIETPCAKMQKSIMGKAEYRDFDVLTYLNLGRSMISGGVYGKYSMTDIEIEGYFNLNARLLSAAKPYAPTDSEVQYGCIDDLHMKNV